MTTWHAHLEGGPWASYVAEVLEIPAAITVARNDDGTCFLQGVDPDVPHAGDVYVLVEQYGNTAAYVWPHTANDLWSWLATAGERARRGDGG